MCWKDKTKPRFRKVMRSPIIVFKVVYKDDLGILSPFRDFRYKCPEVYNLDADLIPEKCKGVKTWTIERGYHSYSLDCTYEDGKVKNSDTLLMDYSWFHITCGSPVVLECRIPKLAKYTKNEGGEIVSDALETVALHTEEQWNKRLEEIKKERCL